MNLKQQHQQDSGLGDKCAVTTVMLLIELLTVAPATAYFLDAAAGVRPSGMGEAFVSVADDVNTMLFNPAGLTRLSSPELAGMYSDLYNHLQARLYTGQTDRLGYDFLAAAVPLSDLAGTLGASWTRFESTFYQENMVTLSYGRGILPQHVLDFGVNLKMLQWSVAANDFSLDPVNFPTARQKTMYTVDAGVLFTPLPGLTFGVAADNLLPANAGFEETSNVPVVLRSGVTFQQKWDDSRIDSFLATLEWDQRAQVNNVKFGMEAWFFGNAVALRSGISQEEATAGAGFRYSPPEGGLSVQVDYAFAYPFQIFDTLGSHRVGMTFRWLPAAAVKKPAKPEVKDKRKPIDIYYQEALKTYLMNDLQASLKWWKKISQEQPENASAKEYIQRIQKRLLAGENTMGTAAAYQKGDNIILKQYTRINPDLTHMDMQLTDVKSSYQPLLEDLEISTVAQHSELGRKYYQQGELSKALEEWEIVQALAPKQANANSEILKIRAQLQAQISGLFQQGMQAFNQRDYSTAFKKFQTVLRLDPQHGQAAFFWSKTKEILTERLEKSYQEGKQQLEKRNYRKALAYLNQTLDVSPDYKEAMDFAQHAKTQLSEVKKVSNDYRTAKALFEELKLSDALGILTPLIRNQTYDTAMFNLFNQIVEQQALSMEYFHAGLNHYSQNRLGQAAENALKSLKLDRQSKARELLVNCYIQQGILAYRQNELPTALKYWEQALPLQNDNVMLNNYIKRAQNKIAFYKQSFGESYSNQK